MDVFKALALGADAVSAGRIIMGPLQEKGAEGVKEQIENDRRTGRGNGKNLLARYKEYRPFGNAGNGIFKPAVLRKKQYLRYCFFIIRCGNCPEICSMIFCNQLHITRGRR